MHTGYLVKRQFIYYFCITRYSNYIMTINMNKKLFWVAVATLVVGVSSCTKEKVTESFSLKVDAENICDDFTDVYESYYNAVGIAKDSDIMTVDIQGKNYNDCVNKFVSLLNKAEGQFSVKTNWEEAVSVVAQDSKYTEVYRKEFGANTENTEYHSDLFSWYNKSELTPKAGEYIKEYYVDTWGSRMSADGLSKKYPKSHDLNDWAGGRYVYMSAVTTRNPAEAVTGAFILKSTTGVCKKEIVYNGVTYQCSSELDNSVLPNYRNRDINEEAGGPWLFLYTTHDESTGKRLLSGTYVCRKMESFGTSSLSSTLDDFLKNQKLTIVGDELEFMPGSYAVSTEDDLNNIKLEHRDGPQERDLNYGQDMNEGAGGRYIYFLLQWEKVPE